MIRKKKTGFREKIRSDVQRQLTERRERQNEEFKKRYDKLKTIEFPKKIINMDKHFYFPKFIGHENFEKLTTASLSIYPVLCSLADFNRNLWFQKSQENIALIAGVTLPTVHQGIKELSKARLIDTNENDEATDIPLLERKKVSEGKRHFYTYRIGFIRQDMMHRWENKFIFYTSIIDSGIWAKLNPRAKALYLAMRTVAKFDFDFYVDIEFDGEYSYNRDLQTDSNYRERKWDICNDSLSELCRMVKIERSNFKQTLNQLEKYKLIEHMYSGQFKVFLRPKIKNIVY